MICMSILFLRKKGVVCCTSREYHWRSTIQEIIGIMITSYLLLFSWFQLFILLLSVYEMGFKLSMNGSWTSYLTSFELPMDGSWTPYLTSFELPMDRSGISYLKSFELPMGGTPYLTNFEFSMDESWTTYLMSRCFLLQWSVINWLIYHMQNTCVPLIYFNV